MGVNELSVHVNEEVPSDSASSITERDQNIPRELPERRGLTKKNSNDSSQGKDDKAIEIVEAGGMVEDPEEVPATTEESTKEADDQEALDSQPAEGDAAQEECQEGKESEEANSNFGSSEIHIDKSDEEVSELLAGNSALATTETPEQEEGVSKLSEEVTQKCEEPTEDILTEVRNSETELCAPDNQCVEAVDSSQKQVESELEAEVASPEQDASSEEGSTDGIEALQLEEQNSDSANSLFEALDFYQKEDKEEEQIVPLELSTNILSYERFYPGRILGNTFVVRNVSSKTARVTLYFDNAGISRVAVGEKLCEYYGCDTVNEIEDSYTKHLKKDVDNSKEALNVWFIEDPYSKRLTKEVQMELEAGEEYEFIVVLKSPVVNKQNMYAANVQVYNHQLETMQSVFCFGCMESLRINCPKEMYNTKLNAKMVKIVMRRKQASQPIKVLLENKGDMPVSATFQSVEMEKNLQFYIPRDKLSIEPNSKALLEIKALHKIGSQGSKTNNSKAPEVIHKLVVAKIKDCEFKFSLIFEITII